MNASIVFSLLCAVLSASSCQMDEAATLNRARVGHRSLLNFDRSNPPQNVRNIILILSEAQFDYLFPLRAAEYTYDAFLSGCAYWPDFCSDAEVCRDELAVMFSHMVQETGAHSSTPLDGVDEWRQGLYHSSEMGCPDLDKCYEYTQWTNAYYPPVDGALYYGRGAKQLSWNYNYGPFSLLMTGDKMTFLNNPEMVMQPEYIFSSAVWFYMTPQAPKPSMHDVVTKCWYPSDNDLAEGRLADSPAQRLALTTHIINGLQECSGSTQNAKWRFEYYLEMSAYFDVPNRPQGMGDYVDCAHSQKFGDDATGAKLMMYMQDDWNLPAGECGCQLVPWYTSFFRTLDMLSACEMDYCGVAGGSKNGPPEAGWLAALSESSEAPATTAMPTEALSTAMPTAAVTTAEPTVMPTESVTTAAPTTLTTEVPLEAESTIPPVLLEASAGEVTVVATGNENAVIIIAIMTLALVCIITAIILCHNCRKDSSKDNLKPDLESQAGSHAQICVAESLRGCSHSDLHE
jgi:chitodextrinase